MKKIGLALIDVVLCSLVNLRLRAQEVQSIELESRVGITFPLGNYFNGNTSIGPSLRLELRYNVPKSSWDCGLALNVTTAARKYYLHDSTFYEQSNRSVNVVLFGDYNFGQARKFNPYVGCGVGISFADIHYNICMFCVLNLKISTNEKKFYSFNGNCFSGIMSG